MSDKVTQLPTPEGDPPQTPQPEAQTNPKTIPPTAPQEAPLKPNAAGKFKGQHIGIDVDRLEAYVGSFKWKIRPDGHIKKVIDALRELQKGYEVEIHRLEDDPKAITFDKEEAYETATKGMLELCLLEFNYEEAANHIDAGPGALGLLANELRSFLVDLGGRAGQKHLQTLSKLATQSGFVGSKSQV